MSISSFHDLILLNYQIADTIRFRRNNSEHSALLEETREVEDGDSTEQQANIIVREMEQHQQLMEDNLQAEELRRYDHSCSYSSLAYLSFFTDSIAWHVFVNGLEGLPL